MSNSDNNPSVNEIKFLFETNGDSNVFFHKLIDFFPAIIYVYNADNKKLSYINRKVTDILGYEYSDIAAWDNDLMKLVLPADAELVKQELEKYNRLNDGENHGYSCRLNHKQGNSKYFTTTGTVLRRNNEGKTAAVLFVANDISNEIQSEEETKALKALMNDREKLLQFGSWVWNAETRKTELSDGMYRLLEYSRPETVTPNDFYIHHLLAGDRETLAAKVRRAIEEKKEFHYTFPLTTALNNKKIVFTIGKIIYNADGTLKKILGVMHDITEETSIHNELLHYKETMIEKEKLLGYGTWEREMNNPIFNWSEGMYYLFGYDPGIDKEKLRIDDDLYNNHLTEDQKKKLQDFKEKVAVSKDVSYNLEYEIITKNNQVKTLESFAKITRDENNKPLKFIGTTRDISQLKDYEQELQRKIKELDRSNKELEEFAYVASHDLQEPLRKITTFGERLQAKFEKELGDEGKIYLTRMMAGAENMRLLIENLLEFSRLSHKDQPFRKCNLNILLKEVQAELELITEETNARISSNELPALEVVPSQIRQLFNNLISNAIKFRAPGISPVITITSQKISSKEKKEYSLSAEAAFYKITVTDNGIGFEQGYAKKIFQIFQRLHGKAEYTGSGIGLTICKKIAENHNGLIFATSTPGKGASFTVILPEKK